MRVHWPESLVASTHTVPKIPESEVSELFWSDEDKEKAMEERDQERKKKSQQKAKSTNPSAKKRNRSEEKPAASKRLRANRASGPSKSLESPENEMTTQPYENMEVDLVPGKVEMDSMEEETDDVHTLDEIDVQMQTEAQITMQPEPAETVQPLESMKVDLDPGAVEADSTEEEMNYDGNTVDETTDNKPEVQMQPEPTTTTQPFESTEVDLAPATMEADSTEEEIEEEEEEFLCGTTNDANTVDETNSNHHVKEKKTKKRMLKELESSLDGIYWNDIIGSGRMVTRSQSRRAALA